MSVKIVQQRVYRSTRPQNERPTSRQRALKIVFLDLGDPVGNFNANMCRKVNENTTDNWKAAVSGTASIRRAADWYLDLLEK